MLDNYTHITLVVDRSGSMSTIRLDAEGGINSLIADQKKVDGKATVTLYQFDDHYETVFGPLDIQDAPVYNLIPRGSTALLDATHKAIAETGTYLSTLPEDLRPSQVKFIVVTDGQENSSVEISAAVLKEAIAHQTDAYNWEFIYIGSDLSGISAAQDQYGFTTTASYVPTAKGVTAMYAGVSHAMTTSRVTRSAMADTLADAYDENSAVTTP